MCLLFWFVRFLKKIIGGGEGYINIIFFDFFFKFEDMNILVNSLYVKELVFFLIVFVK